MRIVMLAAVVVLLGGCGASGGGSEGDASAEQPEAPTSVPSSSPSEPATLLTPVPEPGSGKPGAEASYAGTLAAGVEAGCTLLRTDDGQELLLLGDLGGARSGDRVGVRGVLRADAMTTCQQGTPFEVTSLERLPG